MELSKETLKTTVKDTTILNIYYSGGDWFLTISDIPPHLQRMIDDGYSMNLQLVRKFTDRGQTKPSIRHIPPLDIGKNILTNINITNWFEEVVLGTGNYVSSVQPTGAHYRNYGWWFRNCTFKLKISNMYFGSSKIYKIISYFNSSSSIRLPDNGYDVVDKGDIIEIHQY